MTSAVIGAKRRSLGVSDIRSNCVFKKSKQCYARDRRMMADYHQVTEVKGQNPSSLALVL